MKAKTSSGALLGAAEMLSDDAIKCAQKSLTEKERAQIARRYSKAAPRTAPDSDAEVSAGEGPSKGKGIDPANWANTGLDPKEANASAQQQQLDHYKKYRELAAKNKGKMSKNTKKTH